MATVSMAHAIAPRGSLAPLAMWPHVRKTVRITATAKMARAFASLLGAVMIVPSKHAQTNALARAAALISYVIANLDGLVSTARSAPARRDARDMGYV